VNAHNARWIVVLAAVAGALLGALTTLVASRPSRGRCEVPCATTLRIETTAPAVFTMTCRSGER